jgi:hypothetical protein
MERGRAPENRLPAAPSRHIVAGRLAEVDPSALKAAPDALRQGGRDHF